MERELIVVGAGISGLGFAHLAAQRGQRPLLVEASERVGGAIHSHRFSTTAGEFWVELGAHTCYNTYGTLIDVLAAVGTLDGIRAKRNLPFRLLSAGRLSGVPGALSVPGLLLSLPRALWLRTRGATAGQYFGGLVGRTNFERVVGPALDAMTCQPATDFPADALFRKKPRRKGILRSFTGPAGLSSLVDPVAAQPGLDVRTGMAVERIEKMPGGYRLSLRNGETLVAETLVLAVAPDVAGRLLGGVSAHLADACTAIAMAEFDSLALLFPRDASGLQALAGIIAHDDSFYSALSRDPVADPHHRAFTFHFRPGIEPQRQLTRACEVLGIPREAVLAHVVKHNRLPALRIGHGERISAIDRRLAGGRLALVGNWFAGVSIEDSLLRAVAEVERLYPAPLPAAQ